MKKNSFEEEYINIVNSSAPDMEELWNRISESENTDTDITPFVSAAGECSKSRKTAATGIIRTFAAAAAVIAAVICLKLAISTSTEGNFVSSGEANTYSFVNDTNQDSFEQANEKRADITASSTGWEYNTQVRATANQSYETLNLADSDTGIYTAFSANSEEEEYFVESDVLAQTDFFIDGKVISADITDDDHISYTLEIIHLVCDDDITLPENVNVISRSPYALRNNREYLLPISDKNGEFTVVFDNAPQIEITNDREIVCHNGWKSLTGGNSYSIAYPQVYKDDYFYDRMNITAEASLENLFDTWRSGGE